MGKMGKRLNPICLMLFLLFGFTNRVQGVEREYVYRFENSRFDVSFIEIKVNGNGEGDMRYKKRDEDKEIAEKFKLLPSTIQRLDGLYDGIKFLDSSESLQADKQLPHLGTITLGLRVDGRGREASFNYTKNTMAMRLVDLFRAIENQQRRLIDLRLARQFLPLDLPRQLKNLEGELKKERIAEPSQMLPILSEIALDDNLPLIARNAAERMATQIKRNGGNN